MTETVKRIWIRLPEWELWDKFVKESKTFRNQSAYFTHILINYYKQNEWNSNME